MNTLKQVFVSKRGEIIVGCLALTWGFSQLLDLVAVKLAG